MIALHDYVLVKSRQSIGKVIKVDFNDPDGLSYGVGVDGWCLWYPDGDLTPVMVSQAPRMTPSARQAYEAWADTLDEPDAMKAPKLC